MRQCHPGVQSPRSFCFDLRVRASTEQRLVLTWIYPAALFFLNYCYLFLHLPECSFGAHFKLGATHYNHRCPLVARKEIYKYIYKIKQKAQSDVDINKTHLWGFLNNS